MGSSSVLCNGRGLGLLQSSEDGFGEEAVTPPPGEDLPVVSGPDPRCEAKAAGESCDEEGVCSESGVCLSLRDADGDGVCPGGTVDNDDGDCLDDGESGGGALVDCDDSSDAVSPNVAEVCDDSIDNDCDGAIDGDDIDCGGDDGVIGGGPSYTDEELTDADQDGFCPVGEDLNGDFDCRDPGEVDVNNMTDCDDSDANISPAEAEVCDDGTDNDCDMAIDTDDVDCGGMGGTDGPGDDFIDGDGDGYCPGGEDLDGNGDCLGQDESGPDTPVDCDDQNPDVKPLIAEVCDDGIDNNCNGLVDDADGFCDVPPGFVVDDFVDNDGDGFCPRGVDKNGNGHCRDALLLEPSLTPLDCDDTRASTYPDAPELCNGIDDDCDGRIDDGAPCPGGCETPVQIHGSTYMFCSTPTTWSAARGVCLAAGFDLAKVDNAPETQFLENRVNSGEAGGIWVGGHDSAQEGVWRWVMDDSIFSIHNQSFEGAFTHWAGGEPNTHRGDQEDCLELRDFGPAWNDSKCHFHKRFWCELPR